LTVTFRSRGFFLGRLLVKRADLFFFSLSPLPRPCRLRCGYTAAFDFLPRAFFLFPYEKIPCGFALIAIVPKSGLRFRLCPSQSCACFPLLCTAGTKTTPSCFSGLWVFPSDGLAFFWPLNAVRLNRDERGPWASSLSFLHGYLTYFSLLRSCLEPVF